MKKILFLILFLPLFSCDDWLDVESEVSVTYRNYFKNEKDLERILISIFQSEKLVCAIPRVSAFGYAGLQIDRPNTTAAGFQELNPASFLDKSEINWKAHYRAISLANMLRENRSRFENISKERADFWIAQADFVKALMYFRLAQDWGEAPIAPGSEDPTVQPKSPVDSVLAEAIRWAEAAKRVLPTYEHLTDANGRAITSRQYASLGTVHTLLANIYAWMGGLYGKEEYWRKAEAEASLVIDGKVGTYGLEDDIASLVKNTFGKGRGTKEVILAIEVNDVDDNWYNSSSLEMRYPGLCLVHYPYGVTDPSTIASARSMPRITVRAVEAMYEAADDRRKEFWYKLGETLLIEKEDPETGEKYEVEYVSSYAFINKWRDETYSKNPNVTQGGSKLIAMDGNRVVWRLADLILLRAECRAQLGMAEAVGDLNRVRDRAGLRGYNGSTEKKRLLKEIFHERERELFGEGQRYYDIVRNGYFRDELKGNYKTLTDEEVKNGALYLPVYMHSADKKNPFMKQNTYWLWQQK
ncbi:RagB/SusD family nutrient uptake outer membrane protein [Butyricimonas hominis]|jgi:hypothetical protein|uniref:RagB/SusD family nutrient uptake outer membrane protein n=1 Tax=Butyricimonas hominis TaxID=2763032 RepID=A0ABR7CWT8_9BACT|nr:RagB/SusD family nutrient uptake outer membrane protein [Butyricimonas hominis]MBC5620151.1 RagB/SusD family nutrient uptake outer membrane protein [Butyricimonas hominis]